MTGIMQMILTVICSVVASSGFWAYIQKRHDAHDAKTQMLLGLGHDRIVFLGMYYLERKDENGNHWITQDEYENLNDYLYKPYRELNGNGSAERIMEEVKKLPITSSKY